MVDYKRDVLTLRNLTLLFSVGMFVTLVYYFYTGLGGAEKLATRLVPIALIIHILTVYQAERFYPRLGDIANRIIVTAYILALLAVMIYFEFEYENISIWRQGNYNTWDLVAGTVMFLLVMELSRKAHAILFGVNVVLIFYTLFGNHITIDFFWHPGTSLERIMTSSTLEMATGIYGRYAQLALTLIAAFLLLAAAARGFEAQGAVIQVMRRLAGKRRNNIPQMAVLSSISVGMVSGSGSANTAVTGSFTIPFMKRYGLPPVFAGAVETAASMGGLMMPPLMAVAGFIMAEFLGVPYWDVVLRGAAISFVYFVSLVTVVYLISVRLLPDDPIETPRIILYDRMKTIAFFAAIVVLIVLMGVIGYGAMRAALNTAIFLLVVLMILYLYFKFVHREQAVQNQSLFQNLRTMIETHAELASYLVLLMATLGIMIGLFTVTGFILRMGQMMLQLGDWHVAAMVIMAFAFGWLAGTGLPPTATYIIVAVIIVPPMRQIGIDPWVAHFFAFLVAIWGELSPPTSLTAAVASRIAEASFLKTMFVALKICLPIIVMTFAIFIRSDIVVTTGWAQIADMLLITAAMLAISFATFGGFLRNRLLDAPVRLALAALGLVIIFVEDQAIVTPIAIAAFAIAAFGIYRYSQIIRERTALAADSAERAS